MLHLIGERCSRPSPRRALRARQQHKIASDEVHGRNLFTPILEHNMRGASSGLTGRSRGIFHERSVVRPIRQYAR